jgi:quercetin dioxygenase-like cupin family protein
MSSALLSTDASATCALKIPADKVAHGIISQALLTAPGLRATLFKFAPGQELSEHTSSARVLVQVMSGKCEFTIDGQPHTIGPGELLHMPPKAPHAVRAVDEMTLLVIQATPPTQ